MGMRFSSGSRSNTVCRIFSGKGGRGLPPKSARGFPPKKIRKRGERSTPQFCQIFFIPKQYIFLARFGPFWTVFTPFRSYLMHNHLFLALVGEIFLGPKWRTILRGGGGGVTEKIRLTEFHHVPWRLICCDTSCRCIPPRRNRVEKRLCPRSCWAAVISHPVQENSHLMTFDLEEVLWFAQDVIQRGQIISVQKDTLPVRMYLSKMWKFAKKISTQQFAKKTFQKTSCKKKGVQRKFKIKAKLIHNDNLKKSRKIQSNNLQKCCPVG